MTYFLSMEKFRGGTRHKLKNDASKGKASVKKEKAEGEEHLIDTQYTAHQEKEIGMKTYLHGPMDYAKTLKLLFRVGDVDLPKRGIPVVRRGKNTQIRVHVAKQQGRTYIARECAMYKEERDVFEEMRQRDECDLEKFSQLDNRKQRSLSQAIGGGYKR